MQTILANLIQAVRCFRRAEKLESDASHARYETINGRKMSLATFNKRVRSCSDARSWMKSAERAMEHALRQASDHVVSAPGYTHSPTIAEAARRMPPQCTPADVVYYHAKSALFSASTVEAWASEHFASQQQQQQQQQQQ